MEVTLDDWRSRAVLGTVALTFAIPALALTFGPTPSRFGFQMYSGYGEVSATWQDTEGDEHDVDLGDHVASPRIEIDWTTRLPARLCADLTEARSVEVRQSDRGGDRIGRLTCRR